MGSSHGKSSTIRDQSVEGTVSSDVVETFVAEEKEEILHTRRQKPNPRLSRGVPKGIEGELVVAGWPNWLVSVAGDALNGWLPRRADTFEKIDKIGQGTYSNVYKGRDRLLNKVVALKKVRFDNLDPESVKFMAREIILLRRLGDHPNVIKLEGVVTSKMSYSLYLVFDCMEYDLKGIQEQKGVKLSEPEIKCYMNQLLKGLDHCHSRGILHRDVKTSNLLVNKDGILKIADFGLSTFFDPEQSIPLTSRIVTLFYRPPELLLGSNYYGVGVDLWGVGCVLGELFTGKPIMPGRTEVEQLHKIFKLCGSPSDDFWKKSKLPNAVMFQPIEPYRRILHTTFHDLPAAAVGLMDTLLSIKAEYRGTAALALQNEFFTTEPFACDPSSLPQCPPRKEIDAKKTEIEGSRVRSYARDKSVRAVPAPEANAELKSNIDRRQLIAHSETWNRLEKTNEYVSGCVINEGTNSSTFFQVSSRKEGSENYTQREIRKEPIHDIKGKKKWSGPLPVPSDKMHESEGLDLVEDDQYFGPLPSASKPIDVDKIIREHDRQIQESVERAKQQKKLAKARY
ncbi:probable serine/threonine-protein kinase At1g54610 [Solanum tuberosum]|uniref:Serine/threonine-protein kinase cdk9 n=1 Tax=Solanum tuberosum TaxID=4113 RepID=M1CSW1_SOLTU|nr:PREDICTED: probable serine/threonine-protein kinase At1g54610 [Solanum tuberosum]